MLVAGLAVGLALQAPMRASPAVQRMQGLTMSSDFPWDSSDFLNDPVEYLAEKAPHLVTDDLKEGLDFLVAFERRKESSASALWGELPQMLDMIAMGTAKLQEKSLDADSLAAIIARSDSATMQQLASDSTFAEKKVFFERLATLPEDRRGLLAIHDLVTSMRASGELPLMDQFEGDLEYVSAKCAETNGALSAFYDKYSTLFLSLRKVSMIANAAAQAKQSM